MGRSSERKRSQDSPSAGQPQDVVPRPEVEGNIGPFARAARTYASRGWEVVPLGSPGGKPAKAPVPSGFTGRGHRPASPEQIESWRTSHGSCNIGVVCPVFTDAEGSVRRVVGIDVDHYDKPNPRTGKIEAKRGADRLREWCEANGVPDLLAAAPRTSARGVDNPSGIRWFTVPAGVELAESLCEGVEVIQRHHRYGVAAPSVHPSTGSPYRWYSADGDRCGVPAVAKLPALPVEAIEAAPPRSSGSGLDKGDGAVSLSVVAARDWCRERQGRGQCRAMSATLRLELAALDTAGSRYDTARDGAMALVRLSAEGHPGVQSALAELGGAYEEAVAGEPGRDRTEWRRLCTGAVSAVAASAVSLHGVVCPDRAIEGRESLWPSPSEPYAVAQRVVELLYTTEAGSGPDRRSHVVLRSWKGDLWRWRGSHWAMISEAEIEAEVYPVLAEASYMGAGEQPTELSWKPDKAKLAKVLHALSRLPEVFLPDDYEPSLLAGDDGSEGSGLDSPRGVEIAFANGVLALHRDPGGAVVREWLHHTPERFNFTALPFAYSARAGAPVEWLRFLKSLKLDEDEVALLREWFGYVLAGDMRKHKIFLLLGPTRAGKGVITRTLQRLVGRGNHTSPTLDQFGQNFGLASCVGKSLITINDARFGGARSKAVVERLLNISGCDMSTADRKNRTPWEGVLPGRVMIVSNEPPAMSEASNALTERFIGPLELREKFLGREDVDLERRLARELPAIFTWALSGYERLGEHFTAPKRSEVGRIELAESLQPLVAFLRECARVARDADEFGLWRTPSDRVYEAYRSWCQTNGRMFVLDKPRFSRELRISTNGVVVARRTRRRDGELYQAYWGIKLLDTTYEV